MAMRLPRSVRISSSLRPTRSRPLNRILPPAIRPGGSTRPRTEKPVTDLPEPDSPTRPRMRPLSTVNETPSTALSVPARVSNQVRRSSTARVVLTLLLQAGIEDLAQLVADQVDADDRDQQRDAGEEADPVLAREHELVAVGDQQAEGRLGDGEPDAE